MPALCSLLWRTDLQGPQRAASPSSAVAYSARLAQVAAVRTYVVMFNRCQKPPPETHLPARSFLKASSASAHHSKPVWPLQSKPVPPLPRYLSQFIRMNPLSMPPTPAACTSRSQLLGQALPCGSFITGGWERDHLPLAV